MYLSRRRLKDDLRFTGTYPPGVDLNGHHHGTDDDDDDDEKAELKINKLIAAERQTPHMAAGLLGYLINMRSQETSDFKSHRYRYKSIFDAALSVARLCYIKPRKVYPMLDRHIFVLVESKWHLKRDETLFLSEMSIDGLVDRLSKTMFHIWMNKLNRKKK